MEDSKVQHIASRDLIHHKDFWYEDGNVIVAAGNVAFRLHVSVLSRESPVFRNIFLAEDSVHEIMENYRLVRVSDTAQDMEYLVSAIYHARRFREPNLRLPTDLFASLIRMGHKYEILDLRALGLQHLKALYPMNFAEWQRITDHLGVSGIVMMFVNLALLTGTSSILPPLLYECCQLSDDILLTGYTRPDGIVEQLPQHVLQRCLAGRGNLASANNNARLWVFETNGCSPLCERKNVCSAGIQGLPQFAMKGGWFTTDMAFAPMMEDPSVNDDMVCKKCRSMLARREVDSMQTMWRRLPDILGVSVADWQP
ncbi:hypothetical protein WOLCODRAFT_136319 [Wolfiporia cocos MD-104 SS10]|uniref:BTB domain-containing protein n=1 Tax=Wolfiporia cocos (strain MD-104) TaxID=742152 RepID=A0A2H3JLB8_WOLCO|nr:hypothetical protein WOLCODRAFT_136319 [Wolfiporia cocos MD-104 SS10]